MNQPTPEKTHLLHAFKHNSPFISCCFDPSGEYLFGGAQDSKIWRWKISDQSNISLGGHDSWTRAMAFLPKSEQFVSGGYDGRLIWWPTKAEKPEPQRTIQAHSGWIRTLSVSPDGTQIASAGNDLVIRIWNAQNGDLIQELPGHELHIYSIAFHPTEPNRLVSGDLKANFMVWDTSSGEELAAFKSEALHKYDTTFKADIGGPRDMTFTPDGSHLVASGITNVSNAFAGVGNPLVVVTGWKDHKEVIQHESKGKLRGVAWGVVAHPANFIISVIGGSGGSMLFWKPDGKEEFHLMKLPDNARDLDLHPNGIDLAVAHHDSHLRIYRMAEKAA